MEIKIEKISKELRLKSPDLITRPMGRLLYKKIKKTLQIIDADELVLLDFDEIKVIDSSCIDEFLVKLILDSQTNEKKFFLKLKNISDISEINIDSVFQSFSLYNTKKIAIVTETICSNNSFFIGPLSNEERDIIEYLRINKHVNIDDLCDFIGIDRVSMEKIMDNLYFLRLVKKYKNCIYETL